MVLGKPITSEGEGSQGAWVRNKRNQFLLKTDWKDCPQNSGGGGREKGLEGKTSRCNRLPLRGKWGKADRSDLEISGPKGTDASMQAL